MPRRLRRVSATGNPSWGLAMVAGSKRGKKALAKISVDHCKPLTTTPPIGIGQEYEQTMVAVPR